MACPASAWSRSDPVLVHRPGDRHRRRVRGAVFRKGINALQAMLYGTQDLRQLHSFAEGLPWYRILLIPVAGGLVVGLILHRFTPDGGRAASPR